MCLPQYIVSPRGQTGNRTATQMRHTLLLKDDFSGTKKSTNQTFESGTPCLGVVSPRLPVGKKFLCSFLSCMTCFKLTKIDES